MPALRDPRNDPQPGDCIYRLGAKYCRRYRLVVAREGMDIVFMTSTASTRRVIWLTSWQEWSVGSDIQMVAPNPENGVDVEEMFKLLAEEDAKRKEADISARR